MGLRGTPGFIVEHPVCGFALSIQPLDCRVLPFSFLEEKAAGKTIIAANVLDFVLFDHASQRQACVDVVAAKKVWLNIVTGHAPQLQVLATLNKPDAPHSGTGGGGVPVPVEIAKAVRVPVKYEPAPATTQPVVQEVGGGSDAKQSLVLPGDGCCLVCTPSQL